MGWDYQRKEEKTSELQNSIQKLLKDADLPDGAIEKNTKELLETCISISPPEEEKIVMGLVIMRPSGRGGGRSTKPGNITLNLNKLFTAVSSGAFTVISITQAPWAIPFAFLLLWNSIWENINVILSENEAVTLWAMWQVKNNEKIVKLSDIKPALDKHAVKYERALLSHKDIEFSLSKLKAIGCIKESKNGKDFWRLCEWISPTYR